MAEEIGAREERKIVRVMKMIKAWLYLFMSLTASEAFALVYLPLDIYLY